MDPDVVRIARMGAVTCPPWVRRTRIKKAAKAFAVALSGGVVGCTLIWVVFMFIYAMGG